MKKTLLFILFSGLACCVQKKSSTSETAGGSELGFNDLEPVMFHVGRMESSHLFTPESVTLAQLQAPIDDVALSSIFTRSVAPIFRRAIMSDLVSTTGTSELLPAIAEELRQSLAILASETNYQLSGTRYVINFAMLPYRKSRSKFADNGLAHSGLRGQESAVTFDNNFMKNISDSMRHIQKTAYKQDLYKAYLLGALLKMSLVKDASYATFKLAVGLNPQRIPFAVKAPELDIREIVVPDLYEGTKQTVMLLEFKMSLVKNFPPALTVSFGTLKGLEEAAPSELDIKLKDPSGAYVGGTALNKIYTGLLGIVDFDKSSEAEPYLSTVLKPSKLGASTASVDKLVAADFRFRSLDVDVQRSEIKHAAMGVSIGAEYKSLRFTTGFFSSDNIDKQFKEQINLNLSAAMNSFKDSTGALVSKLMEGK